MGSSFHDHPHFKKGVKNRAKTDFTIVHYAGDVSYTINGFIDKNKDTLYPSLTKMMSESSCSLIRSLFPKVLCCRCRACHREKLTDCYL